MEWIFKNTTDKDCITGYEDVMETLKNYTHDKYASSNDFEKQSMIDTIFSIYRNKNIFPIMYFNESGIKKEIQKCIDKEVGFNHGTLDLRFNQGSALIKNLFPNLQMVQVKNTKNNSLYERFYDDHKLKRAIEFSLKFKKSVTPSEIFGSLQMIGGNPPTSFNIMKAKALYEKYVPKNGVIYDFACGFGSRMLGALSSRNNYTYVGVEPCTDTFESLNLLGKEIEKVTNRKDSFRVIKIGSEDFKVSKEYFDFAFSSPCYFSLEKYSDEESQSYNKFPTLDEWIKGFVKPTILNIYNGLKRGRYYGVNINDFNIGKKRIKYVEKWIEISKEIGFEFVEKIELGIQTRTGNGFKKDGANIKRSEGIYIFKK